MRVERICLPLSHTIGSFAQPLMLRKRPTLGPPILNHKWWTKKASSTRPKGLAAQPGKSNSIHLRFLDLLSPPNRQTPSPPPCKPDPKRLIGRVCNRGRGEGRGAYRRRKETQQQFRRICWTHVLLPVSLTGRAINASAAIFFFVLALSIPPRCTDSPPIEHSPNFA